MPASASGCEVSAMSLRHFALALLLAPMPGVAGMAMASDKPALAPLAPDHACRGVEGYARAFGGRRTFFLKPDQMVAIKAARDSDPAVKAAYATLIARADAALARKPGSVMDKTTIPLSGDRHDYLS